MIDHDLHFNRVQDCVEVLKKYAATLPEEHYAPLADHIGTLSMALQELEQVNRSLADQYSHLIKAYRGSEGQRRRYQALFELTPDGYLITDTNTVIQEANSVASVLLHAARDSVTGKSLMEFISEDDSEAFSEWIEGWSTWNELQEREVHIQSEQGEVFPVSLTVATMNNVEGKVIGLRWLIRDITEQKRAEEERAQLAAIVTSSSDAIISRTLDGMIESWNTGAEKLYGYSLEEVRGKPISMLFVPSSIEEETAILDKIAQGASVAHYETIRLGKDGNPIYVALTASPVRNDSGFIIGASEIARDIGERKQIEAAEREQRVLAEALRDSATAINSTLNLSEVLDRILANVTRVVPQDAAEILLIQEGTARIVRSRGYAERGWENQIAALRLTVSETPTLHEMFETGQPLLIPDTRDYPGWVNLIPEEWLRGYVGVPILFHDQVIGFINFVSEIPGFFTPVHTERLQAFAEQAAIAIHNAQLYEEAQELATAKERQRLARDLHDAVSQTLFSSSIIAEALPRLWERDPEKLWPYLIQLNRLNRGALAEMRNLLMEMRPGKIMEVEFNDLLSQLIQAVMGRTQITVALTIEGRHSLPPDVRIIFYRIAQEALNNTVKHAHATQISVYLGNKTQQVEMRLQDNGIGFDPNEPPSKGMGLSIMQERAKLIGAKLQITSQIGQGTEITLLWLDTKGETHDNNRPHSSHDR